MYDTRRQTGARWLMALMLVIIVGGGLVIYWGLNTTPVRRRLEALPYYARTYVNQLRPTPEIPAPPSVSTIAPATLLQRPRDTTELGSTPAYFNDASLNPTDGAIVGQGAVAAPATPAEPPNPGAEPVVLVESSALSVAPIAPRVALSGVSHQWQTWNNCGPATITMNLSYYGRSETQADSALFLKPNQDDKNVSPHELAAYAQTLGYEAVVRVGGTMTLLKQLLSNGFPVIVETWLNPEDKGGLGHYRLFTGYDEAGGYFIAEDSLNGSGIQVSFAGFDPLWRVFNRTYLVVYPPEQTALVHALIGQAMLDQPMFETALATARAEAQADPTDAYAWFNLGTNYARLGQPALAASAFDEARRIGLPYRMLWYQFDLFESYLAVGRHQEVIDLSTALLKATGGLEELYYYRGLARQALGQGQLADDDFRAALDYNPNFSRAAEALAALGAS